MSSTAHLAKRHRAEKRFRFYGILSIGFSMAVLLFLLGSLLLQGWTGFFQTQIQLHLTVPDTSAPESVSYNRVIQDSLRTLFPEATSRADGKALNGLLSAGASSMVRHAVDAQPANTQMALWLPASDKADLFIKGKISEATPPEARMITDQQIAWIKTLQQRGDVRKIFNLNFLSSGDSREPEQAGFAGSIIGSALTMLICMSLAFPFGVMTAIYLEEFAPRNRFVDFIEVNINNLAAIPSIVFGLLGLAVFLNTFGLPRSSAIVGGLTLSLMILPIIIITTRVALKAVPDSIRNAARALGASPLQVVLHHVLPLSMPGIMTGTILGVARAIGETAPLLMIGMVAFIADIPSSFSTPATVMPVQIYLWASSPETGFVEKTAAGILVLLVLLVIMNSLAIYLRKRYEQRW